MVSFPTIEKPSAHENWQTWLLVALPPSQLAPAVTPDAVTSIDEHWFSVQEGLVPHTPSESHVISCAPTIVYPAEQENEHVGFDEAGPPLQSAPAVVPLAVMSSAWQIGSQTKFVVADSPVSAVIGQENVPLASAYWPESESHFTSQLVSSIVDSWWFVRHALLLESSGMTPVPKAN
jgi:hypothetical protein